MAAFVAHTHPGVHWWCPQLPPSPKHAMQLLLTGLAQWQRDASAAKLAVMGSSLGGFYATAVAERMGCKAVLLNPAVEPARDLSHHIGEQTAWHNASERFFFAPQFIGELHDLQGGPLNAPENYLAIIAKGDEVLDWREMTARYEGAQIHLLEGGDHALSDFDTHLPLIADFLGLACASKR